MKNEPTEFSRETKESYTWYTWEGWRNKGGIIEWAWRETCWGGYDSVEEAYTAITINPKDKFGCAAAFFLGRTKRLVKSVVTYENAGNDVSDQEIDALAFQLLDITRSDIMTCKSALMASENDLTKAKEYIQSCHQT